MRDDGKEPPDQRAKADTIPKKVDTLALRGRIVSDRMDEDLRNYILKNPKSSEDENTQAQKPSKMKSIRKDSATVANRIKAERDTLDKARKGKIPAK